MHLVVGRPCSALRPYPHSPSSSQDPACSPHPLHLEAPPTLDLFPQNSAPAQLFLPPLHPLPKAHQPATHASLGEEGQRYEQQAGVPSGEKVEQGQKEVEQERGLGVEHGLAMVQAPVVPPLLGSFQRQCSKSGELVCLHIRRFLPHLGRLSFPKPLISTTHAPYSKETLGRVKRCRLFK